MTDFQIKLLSEADGSWAAFCTDWRLQCEEVGEIYEEYAAEPLKVIEDIVLGRTPSLGGTTTTHVGALWDAESKRYYAACMLSRAMLPQTSGYTIRVRHLIVSPAIDYGTSAIQMYPDVVVGVMLGIVYLSSNVLSANNIHFHLRSPEDMRFFHAFGRSLGRHEIFASVKMRGAWLYIEKIGAVGTAATEERND